MSVAVKAWRAFVVVTAAMAAAALVTAAFTFNDARSKQDRIQQAQLDSCVRVGDPILTGLKQTIADQIAASATITPDQYQKLFPGFDPGTLRRLVAVQQAKRRRVLRKLERVPSCAARFSH